MDAELQKLVESGKLTSKAAEQLDKLKPGTFCLHKSWGFGRVSEWNLLLNQIIIDFAGKKAHPMQLQYAAENLAAIPPEHFLARKASDLAAIKKLAREDPAAVIRNVLESAGGNATVPQIAEWLIGDVFSETEWKRWWESAKKVLKKDGHFFIPTKKSAPIELRSAPVSQADEFKEPDKQLQPIIAAIENAAARNQKLHPELSFELLLGRDDLLARIPQLRTTHVGLTVAKMIAAEEPRLMSILPNLPAAKEKRILQALPEALGERWMNYALRLIYGNSARVVSQVARVFAELGEEAELRAALERSIREHSATSEMLIWLCKERDGAWCELITPDLLTAILAAVERDQHRESRANRLRDLVLEDRELIADMFAGADVGAARDTVRRLLITPAFDELTKRSLLARIVKLYPELEIMITGGQREEKVAALIVSWSSLTKRRAEHEELVKKKIPENSKEIALARSYGDLSENFEFKAAKQMQAVLMRRKSELEQALHNARGTAFENPDTSRVSIGTIVTLREPDSGKEEAYTILGAWDGDPERHIISYQTAIGQALMGHKVGDVVTLNNDEGAGASEIVSISAAPIDQTPVEVEDAATVDAVSA